MIGLTVPSCAEGPTLLPADAGSLADAHRDAGPELDAIVCDEVETWPNSDGTDSVTYRRYRWDPTQRVRTQESRSDRNFDGFVKLAWRYDSDGKVLAYAGFEREPGYGNFQHDREYDPQGNLSDFRLSYPDKPDLNVPSPADTWMGTRYEHEYDAQDKLQASTITPYGPGNSSPLVERVEYQHDAAERCASKLINIEGRDSIKERFVYDSRDRLIEEHQTGRSNGPFACTGSITTISYDDRDRVTARRTWACGRATNTPADVELVHTYDAQGGRRTEIIDQLTDVVNDMIITPEGEALWVSHTIETQSPGCATIAAAIGGPKDQRCRVR